MSRFAKSLLRGLIKDVAFLEDENHALNQHRLHDGVLALLGKALYSITLTLVFIAVSMHILAYASILSLGMFLSALYALTWDPFPPLAIWPTVLAIVGVVILAKLVWNLPIFCDWPPRFNWTEGYCGDDPNSPGVRSRAP